MLADISLACNSRTNYLFWIYLSVGFFWIWGLLWFCFGVFLGIMVFEFGSDLDMFLNEGWFFCFERMIAIWSYMWIWMIGVFYSMFDLSRLFIYLYFIFLGQIYKLDWTIITKKFVMPYFFIWLGNQGLLTSCIHINELLQLEPCYGFILFYWIILPCNRG